MKLIWYKVSIAIVGIFVIIALFVAIYYNFDSTQPQKVQNTVEQHYILKEYNEKIAVFKVGEEEPAEVLSIYVSTLPVQDQMKLISGIEITSDAALRNILEDYES